MASSSGVERAKPDWRDPGLGTRVRVALWLADEVGEGNTFTKVQLSDAIRAQEVDRRLRDLRPAGWILDSPREDPALKRGEMRLAKIGDPVWQSEHRASGLRILTAGARRAVLARDGYRCHRCGVRGGEPYPDDPSVTAVLVVNHVDAARRQDWHDVSSLVTECTRCSAGDRQAGDPGTRSLDSVWAEVSALSGEDQARVLAWLVKGRRELTPAEKAFVSVWRLASGQRDELLSRLADEVGS